MKSKDLGFVKVGSAIPVVEVANPIANADRIIAIVKNAEEKGVKLLSFPELCVSAYTCADLFFHKTLQNECVKQTLRIAEETKDLQLCLIVGLPLNVNGRLYNVAAVIKNGEIKGIVPKIHLPNTNEFYEKRWFSSGVERLSDYICLEGKEIPFSTNLLFNWDDIVFGIEICEDLWVPNAPGNNLSVAGAHIIFNLSASDELIGKEEYRRNLVSIQSAKCHCGYVYTSAGFGESSTDLVFSGSSIITENGSVLSTSERFSIEEQIITADIDIHRLEADRRKNTEYKKASVNSDPYTIIPIDNDSCNNAYTKKEEIERNFSPTPFVPTDEDMRGRCNEIFSIQVGGLATRLYHTGIKKAVVGISGGLDSTLALLVTVKTFDKLGIPRENIVGITMPGFGTTGRTYNNSLQMMKELGVTIKEINIKKSCLQHLEDIGHDLNILDVTYENAQARERTQILMDYANKIGGLVIGTGDLSELVLGWATYNGDHMSMYAVNTSVPKTLVRYLVNYAANYEVGENAKKVLLDVCDTPISPELLPADDKGEIAQKTEELVGPYELHDFFIYYTLRFGLSPTKIFFMAQKAFEGTYDKSFIKKWMLVFYKRFFAQQFKRSCMPDGPKVGSVNLSPRGDLRMPSDASCKIWMKECEEME